MSGAVFAALQPDMLGWLVVIHSDFVHVLRPGNAWIVERHLGLSPRHRRAKARASSPAVLAAGRPLLLLAMDHELEPIPGLLGAASLVARRRILPAPHFLGLIHGGIAAARERGVVEVRERAARIRGDRGRARGGLRCLEVGGWVGS
jgi:hypothetical protein